MEKDDIITVWIPDGDGFRGVLVSKEVAQKNNIRRGSIISMKQANKLTRDELDMTISELELKEAIEKDYDK